MKIVTLLKAVGYEIELNGDKIKYRYTLPGDPPEDKVKPLLDELKKHKDEVVTHLKIKKESSVPTISPAEPITETTEPQNPLEVTSNRPYWQRPDGSCRVCNGKEAWLSVYDVIVCIRCHPPAHDSLVARWGHA